jgi:hypothetical protein
LGSLNNKTSLGGSKVSLRKISNKSLSRNLKARKAPLRVLPMTSFPLRHPEKQTKKQHTMEGARPIPHPPSTIPPSTRQYAVEEVTRFSDKKSKKYGRGGPITIRPFIRLHFTMNALRWILLLIFAYIAAGIVVVMIQDGTEVLKNIVIYSIIGFFTFFMGYIGWILARDVLQMVSGNKDALNEAKVDT